MMRFADCYLTNERYLGKTKTGKNRYKFDIINGRGEVEFKDVTVHGITGLNYSAQTRIESAGIINGEIVYKMRYILPPKSAYIHVKQYGRTYKLTNISEYAPSVFQKIAPRNFSHHNFVPAY